MITRDLTSKKVILHLLKDFSSTHTITILAKELGLSRVGTWKILRKLESEKYVVVTTVGTGKTSTSIIMLNWDSPLIEKMLSFYLTEEALKQRRWQVNFLDVERAADFVILWRKLHE